MKALLVIDMLNDFCKEDGALYVGDQVKPVIDRCTELINKAVEEKDLVMFISDYHIEDDEEFKLFPPHAIIGTSGSKVIDKLDSGLLEYKKHRFSGFHNTCIDSNLQFNNIETVHIVGVCTDICVMYTAADARNRDYRVAVHKDAVTSFNLEAHEHAIEHMKNILGCEIVGVKDE